MRRRWAGGVALLLWVLAGRAAWAQTCTVGSTGLTFGIYDPFASNAASITGTVSVTCQAVVAIGLSYVVQIGAGGGGAFGARALAAGSGRLSYQLYTTMTGGIVWGDGTGTTGVVSDGYVLGVLASTTKTYTIYGTIRARQMVPPGTYSDVATVMLVY